MSPSPTDPPQSAGDPARIRVVVVHADDVVTALEARIRSRRQTVLRVTPPFSGRMRARLHDMAVEASDAAIEDSPQPSETASESASASADPIHIHPRDLVTDPPVYPDPDETEDRLRERGVYTIETHRERHAAAVSEWRDTVQDRIAETVSIEIERRNGVHRAQTEGAQESPTSHTSPEQSPRSPELGSGSRHEIRVSVLGMSDADR